MYTQTHRVRSSEPIPNWGRLQRQCACGAAQPRREEECPACRQRRLSGLQPRLTVNAYEQEADRIADAVLESGTGGYPMTTPLRVQRYSPGSDGQAAAPPLVDQVLAAPG